MPNTDVELSLSCPRCGHHGSQLQIASATVLTVTCAECRHTWSVDSSTLPPDVRAQVTKAITTHR